MENSVGWKFYCLYALADTLGRNTRVLFDGVMCTVSKPKTHTHTTV